MICACCIYDVCVCCVCHVCMCWKVGLLGIFWVLGCKVTAVSKRQEDPTIFLSREGEGLMISGSWVGRLGDWCSWV